MNKKFLSLSLFIFLSFVLKTEAALWTPADISTTLWLDASDEATVTRNATGTVSQWNDKSGNGSNITQGTSTNQPYYHPTSKYDKWTNIAVSSPRGVAVSRDGNYVAYGALASYLFVSSDRGETWTTRLTDQTRTIRHIAMSSDGQYMSVSPDSTGGHLCSDDYGVNWTVRGDNTRFPATVIMSSNGAIRLAAWTVSGLTGNMLPEISTDYGVTWTPVSGFASSSNWRFGMSASGQYMIAINVPAATTYISSDYGVNWSSAAMDGSPTASPIAISDDGKYISYGVFNGLIRQSSDYGSTWSSVTNLGSARWFHSAMSADGSIRIVAKDAGGGESQIWISIDYGVTYYPVYDNNLGVFRMAMSADGSVMAKTGVSVSISNADQVDKGSIYFNGSSNYLNLPTGILNNLSELTTAFVMRAPSGQTSKGVFGMSSGSGQGLELYFTPTTTVRINNTANSSSTAFWSNDNNLSVTTMTDSATALDLWKNGVSALSTTGNAALNFNGVNTLGRYNSTAYANMTMSEFIIASSSLSISDRQKLEGYLAWKWGTQSSLPADHSYKLAAPLLAPTTPTNLVASSVSTSTLNLSWDTISDADGYQISANNSFATTTTTSISTLVSNLNSGTSYTFNVSAYNNGGTSSAATISATTSVALSYLAGPNGSITGSTTQVVAYGGNGTEVTAVPDTSGIHYHFASWSDGATSTSRTDTNVTSNLTLTATFATHDDIVEYIAGPNGTLTGSTTQEVSHGASTTPVTAVPDRGYYFIDWSDGSTANPRYESYVNGPLSVTANFEKTPRKTSGSSVKTRIANLIDMGKTKEAQTLATKFPQVTPSQTTLNTNTFTRDLEITLSGEDVKALQNILISKGYSIPAGATGYFGAQTQAALIKYQKDNNITPAAGYLGPITRGRIIQ